MNQSRMEFLWRPSVSLGPQAQVFTHVNQVSGLMHDCVQRVFLWPLSH
jgi:hypothetical protein